MYRSRLCQKYVWDKLHDYHYDTPLNDLDLIHFNRSDTSESTDKHHEQFLKSKLDLPWSVKNQARMHLRNHDAPYQSTPDAMSHWVEVETAIGCRLSLTGEIELVAPFGLKSLFSYTITVNNTYRNFDAFQARIFEKQWLLRWPKFKVITE